MKKIRKTLRRCDQFGAEVKLNLSGKESFKSDFGGGCTIVLYTLIILIAVNGCINLFNRKSFTVIQIPRSVTPSFELSNRDFMLAVDSAATIKQITQSYNEDGTIKISTSEAISLETCTPQHFRAFPGETIRNRLLIGNLQEYHCLPIVNKVLLQGTIQSDIYTYAEIMFSGTSTNLIYLDAIPTPYESEPHEDKIQFFQNINELILTLEQNSLQIDNSIFPTIEQNSDTKIYSVTRQQGKTPGTLQIIASPYIQEYHKQFARIDTFFSYLGGITKFILSFIGYFIWRYNRTGLQVRLANSMYQFDIPVTREGKRSSTIQDLYLGIAHQIRRADQLYEKLKNGTRKLVQMNRMTKVFRQVGLHKSQVISTTTQPKLLSQTQHRPPVEEPEHEDLRETQQSILSSVIESIVDSKKRVKYGLLSSLISFVSPNKSDALITKQLVEQSQKMILKDMDILTIMDKLQEVGKMKHILLDKNQQRVFNCLPKPVVSFVDKKNEDQITPSHVQTILINQELTEKQRKKKKCLLGGRHRFENKDQLNKLYKAYERIKCGDESPIQISTLNERIISLLEPSIQRSFKSLGQLSDLAEHHHEKIERSPSIQIRTAPALQSKPSARNIYPQNDEIHEDPHEEALFSKQSLSRYDTIQLDRPRANYRPSWVNQKSDLIEQPYKNIDTNSIQDDP